MAIKLKDECENNEIVYIHEIARQAKVCFDRRVSGLGLTRTQLHVLNVLRRNPEIGQSRLAEIIEVEPMTLCRMLDRMEKAKWLKRVADKNDRRIKRVVLTDKVAPIVGELSTNSLRLRRDFLKGFSEEEHENLISYLLRIKANIADVLSNNSKN